MYFLISVFITQYYTIPRQYEELLLSYIKCDFSIFRLYIFQIFYNELLLISFLMKLMHMDSLKCQILQ